MVVALVAVLGLLAVPTIAQDKPNILIIWGDDTGGVPDTHPRQQGAPARCQSHIRGVGHTSGESIPGREDPQESPERGVPNRIRTRVAQDEIRVWHLTWGS